VEPNSSAGHVLSIKLEKTHKKNRRKYQAWAMNQIPPGKVLAIWHGLVRNIAFHGHKVI
jgi:hypothetical protein